MILDECSLDSIPAFARGGHVRRVVMIAEQTSQILEHLEADAERQSGHLSWDDVHQVILGHSLSASEAVRVWQEASTRFCLVTEGTGTADSTISCGQRFLTAAEERTLTRRVAAARIAAEADRMSILPAGLKSMICGKGKDAFDQLVVSNTGLVGAAAAEFAPRTHRLDRDDLFQEGILGLMRAIEKFDHDKGYRLTTYATWWIRQHIRRAIESKARTIRLPCHIEGALRELTPMVAG